MVLSSCSSPLTFISSLFRKETAEPEVVAPEYEYEILENNKIKLTKYNGEQKPLITVPTLYDGKEVALIGKGCFKKNKTNNRTHTRGEEHEDEDCSTYYIDSSIEGIEDGAFDSDSSFITDAEENNEEWNDSAMTGCAQDAEGNVYYDTSSEYTYIQDEIVYVYYPRLMGYFLARCLSREKEIVLPSIVNDKKVVNIGMLSFYENRYIEKVTLPETTGQILQKAFENCSNLKEVVFNCPNLGSVGSHSFTNCDKLDVVKLSDNITTISSYSFAYCGTISEFYMPASVNTLYSNAFFETNIETLYYAGTQERFETYVLTNANREMLNGTTIVYGGQEMDAIELNNVEDVVNYPINTKVKVTGIISGFSNYYRNTNYRDVMIINPETNYVLKCYNHKGAPFSEEMYIGYKVTVTGTIESYYATIELTQCEFVLYNEPPVTLSPIFFDYTDANFNFDNYANHYCYIEATIAGFDEQTVFFEGVDNFIGFCKNRPYESYEVMSIGNRIVTEGWAQMYNQTPQFVFDIRTVRLAESE